MSKATVYIVTFIVFIIAMFMSSIIAYFIVNDYMPFISVANVMLSLLAIITYAMGFYMLHMIWNDEYK